MDGRFGEMSIILIGYRCTGKTSVGRIISERLRLPFYDTDELISKKTGRTVREIVEEKGWGFFRGMEKEIIRSLTSTRGVIAPGGGAVMDEENAGRMKASGLIIWLKAEPDAILERLKRDEATSCQRPPLSGDLDAEEEILKMLKERNPVYERLANIIVDTTKLSMEDAAARICSMINAMEDGAVKRPRNLNDRTS